MQRAFSHPDDANARRLRLAPLLLLTAGLLLRIYFQRRWAFIATDSLLYQDIAHNWLYAHVYGLSTANPPRPTLIRLPGYPAVLAALAWVFDRWFHPAIGSLRSFRPVLWLQIFVDLATCCLVARIARRMFGYRAGLVALALACLCPFTANYTAVPLTETLTLFFLVLAFATLTRWCERPSTQDIVVISVSLAASVMLRPDQGLLAACILPALYACGASTTLKRRLAPALLCAVLVAVPFAPWTLRNWHVFHVIQPLSPKQAVDPGESAPLSFEHWFRTWAVDFSANDDAYWNYPEDPVVIENLPPRAFDTPAQRDRTIHLLQQAAAAKKLDPQIEEGLQALAEERIHAHPLRYYIALPFARLVNMLFHPRVEMLPIDNRWWQFHPHPWKATFAWLYGALNLAYFLAALAGLRGALRANRVLALSMVGYIALRCLLLLTLDNAEQRYTLEFFPILIVFASALARQKQNA
jgi:4-amino-4-deoxy-L-arabinose transferase-like glycosyltransferase